MQYFEDIAALYKKLQAQVCNTMEKSDGGVKFSKDTWQKDIGYGITRVISRGNKIEKGAVNFSKVTGPVTDKMAQALEVKGERFSATGISSIFHAKNPFVPTIHMNVRYFTMNNGLEWFGGGIDLTPVYIDIGQTRAFHRRMKETCRKYHYSFYPDFKKWADDYFFLPHRNETRGVGGIFFDRMIPSEILDIEQWIQFTTELTELYPVLYSELLEKYGQKSFNDKNSFWQKIRWGRYTEFNLIYDRGTKFGLESGGNTESILISLPPDAKWEYNYIPEKDSEEEKTQQLLKKGIDWINYSKD